MKYSKWPLRSPSFGFALFGHAGLFVKATIASRWLASMSWLIAAWVGKRPVPPDTDPCVLQRVVPEERRVVGERVSDLGGSRRVFRVDAGRCAEQHRRVGHVACDRAGRVLIGADGDDACAAPQPERRLNADVAVRAGGADNRAVSLGAGRGNSQGGGCKGPRARTL